MNYNEIVKAAKYYDSMDSNLCERVLGVSGQHIYENVIIAPSWEPSSLPNIGKGVLINSKDTLFNSIKVWTIEYNNVKFTYIKTGFGAPLLMDSLLTLGVTDCKKIIFIGSVGALNGNIGIGDIVIPQYSFCGDGASRYITSCDLSDCYGEKVSPNYKLYGQLLSIVDNVCQNKSVKWHIGNTFSADTIVAQFVHLKNIMNRGCNSIDMETAVAFKCAKLMNIPICAILIVSDNALAGYSLLKGRKTLGSKDYRRYVKKEILPQIIHRLIIDSSL